MIQRDGADAVYAELGVKPVCKTLKTSISVIY